MIKKLLKFILSFFIGCILVEIIVVSFFGIWKPIYQRFLDDDSFYIYVLGESTTLGFPFEDKVSPVSLLNFQFNDTLIGKKVEVVEIAQLGRDARYNYLQFYFISKITPHNNALVFLYSGINENINHNQCLRGERLWIDSHILFLTSCVDYLSYQASILYYLIFGNRDMHNCSILYEFYLDEIHKIALDNGWPVFTSQLVGNISDWDPPVQSDDNLLLTANRSNQDNLESKTSIDCSCDYLHSNICKNPSLLLYLQARCKLAIGELDSAKMYFDLLHESNSYTGYANWKNQIIESISKKNGSICLPFYQRLADSSANGIIGNNFIWDAHHPNIKGYVILGRLLAEAVSEKYNYPLKRVINDSIVINNFDLDNVFWSDVYKQSTEWYIWECFQTKYRLQRLERLKELLFTFKQLSSTDNMIV